MDGFAGVTPIEVSATPTNPIPLRLNAWGLLGAESFTVTAPVLLPVAVGAKRTTIVQLAPPARVPGHVFV